jgi:hypothetical protein
MKEAEFPDSSPQYCKDCWGSLSNDEKRRSEGESDDTDTEHEAEDEETGIDDASEDGDDDAGD